MSFVKSILEMSLAGGVMIAAVIAVRALTLKRLPKRTFPVLWYAALARLLVPLSLPCTLSVFTLWERLSEAPAAAEPVTVSVPAVVPAAPVAPVYAPPPPAVNAPPPVAVGAPVSFSINGETVAILLWLLGVIVCAAFFTVVYLRSRREFNQSLPLENDFVRSWLDGHRLRRKISLRQSDRIGAPLTYGVLRPVILMPKCTDWDDGEAVKYVLEHEFAHVRRFDAAGKLLLTAAVCLHWFNPLVWGMYVLANRDLELACDESVLRRLGRETRAEYAMTLIRMAEAEGKNGPAPLCSGFGKSAVEERITAIMKMKKTSLAALLVAAGLVVGVTTVFATSAATADKEELDRRANAKAVTDAQTVMSIIGEDGKTWYSTDGGKTWISQEEFDAAYPETEVEWWTYDEYAAWLENEKIELQDMLGERGWTPSRGWFVWTQKEIDATVAMYEDILEQIGRGVKVSKTVNGSEDTMLMQSPYDILLGIGESEPTAEDFAEYEQFGLEWREAEKALYYKGERVRYFIDGAELDVGMAVRFEYADAELRGDIDVRAVRSRVDNGDGSYDPTGPLLRLEKYSQAEFEAHTFTAPFGAGDSLRAVTVGGDVWLPDIDAQMEDYVPFGLSYKIHPVTGELSMSYEGKPVHAVSDTVAGVWIANSMNGFYLGPDAVDLEAVYEGGKLTGLKASPAPATQTVTIDGENYAPAIGLDSQGKEIHGYVRRSDLGDVAANPAEALEYMKNLNTAPRDIPLYDDAGKVIGTFTVGSTGASAHAEAVTAVAGNAPAAPQTLTINGESYTLVVGHDEQRNTLEGYIRDKDLENKHGENVGCIVYGRLDPPHCYTIPMYDSEGKRIGFYDVLPGADGRWVPAETLALDTGTGSGEPGTTFAEKFEKYMRFCVYYIEDEGASGRGNLYQYDHFNADGTPQNKYLISRLVDVAPDGSVFTYDSAKSGGVTMQAVYGADGTLMYLTVTDSPAKAPAVKEGEEFRSVSGLAYAWGRSSGISYIRSSDYKPGIGLVPMYDRHGNVVGCFNTDDYSDEFDDLRSWKFLNGVMCVHGWGSDFDGNDILGYLSEDDISPHTGDTPEEVIQWHKDHDGTVREFPLYGDNGEVIGTYTCGGSTITLPPDIKDIDEARDYLKNYGNDE